MGDALLSANIDIPDRFYYDFSLQFCRESHFKLPEETREMLIYLLVEDQIEPNLKNCTQVPNLTWNRIDIEKVNFKCVFLENFVIVLRFFGRVN